LQQCISPLLATIQTIDISCFGQQISAPAAAAYLKTAPARYTKIIRDANIKPE